MISFLLGSYVGIFFSLCFGWIFRIVTYVFQGIGFFQIAKSRGIKNPWLAWIPVGNLWVLGSISDQYRLRACGQQNNRASGLVWMSVGRMLCNVLLVITPLALILVTATNISSIDFESVYAAVYAAGTGVGILMIVLYAGLGVLYVVRLVIEYMAYWDLFRSCNPRTSKVFFFVGIFTGLLLPIFVFVSRNKHLGMPQPQWKEPAVSETAEAEPSQQISES